ncbi:MAG: hypothetical protein CL797_08065 [Chromatiales bacterium]|jgi:hypothetical protein|nr:hypothetical protein [Chromatiales bacterium]
MNERELIAFELGFDTAMYGQCVPEDATGLFCDGYRTGKRQYPHPKQTNRYILKWLQIRRGALCRDKRVDERITPEYLEQIDLDRCPVTLEPLTHSTGRDTDWSIDRCNNLRGYMPGNLVIMSTRANKAKSDLAFAEIVANGKCDEDAEGLSPEEWQRMADVVAPAERLADGEPPAQFLLGESYVPGQPYGLQAQVQAALFFGLLLYRQTKDDDGSIGQIYAATLTNKDSRRTFDKMMQDMVRRIVHQGRNWDYWSLKRPLRLFVEFWVTLTPSMRETIGLEIGFDVTAVDAERFRSSAPDNGLRPTH